ncbi:MAG TPA: Ppx/GppA phosphatase family protein [Candidatus Binatia bacterium]|nr:Ppx/GppA phosphatase family protein [Candidatus Binatia bacterium]
MRLATIDLGSNTVRLLVADVVGAGRWRVVDADQRVTRLGEGLAASGRLGEAPAARTAALVAEYVARARGAGAERVAIVATSAVREAANGRAFAAGLERATGETVSVVSGEQEAALTLAGVLGGVGDTPGAATPGAEGDTMVFDIGGGSTEYILAAGGTTVAMVSLRLGVVDLTERHPFPGPVEAARFRALRDEVAARLAAEVPATMRAAPVARLIGTAGTATTLAALDLGLTTYDPARVQGHTLTRGAIDAQLARLGALTVGERAALPCLEPGRADLIVPGLAIVLATLELVGTDRMVVSDWGLREGILLSLCP